MSVSLGVTHAYKNHAPNVMDQVVSNIGAFCYEMYLFSTAVIWYCSPTLYEYPSYDNRPPEAAPLIMVQFSLLCAVICVAWLAYTYFTNGIMSFIIPKVKAKFFRFMARILPDPKAKRKSNVVTQNSLALDSDSVDSDSEDKYSIDSIDEEKTDTM
eukprot:Pgem_evm1s3809